MSEQEASTPKAVETELDFESEYDVIVVGAGAAGIGMGVVLGHLGVPRYCIVDRHEIGASFRRWPREMRFITPSFPSNAFGSMDLNSIAVMTSPGYSLDREHPSGNGYADYLVNVATHFEQPVATGVEVETIQPLPEGGFVLHTGRGDVRTRFVVWAAGEFQYPRRYPFQGAELCVHTSEVGSWSGYGNDEVIVIGGYESGIDAATNLWVQGRTVTVLDPKESWSTQSSDPSISLSLFTRERLDTALPSGRVTLVSEARVVRVTESVDGYTVESEDGREWTTATRPVLATGFAGSARQHPELWDWSEAGYPLVTEEADESVRVPGLFLAGPLVRHGDISFCFIYKFRQRFALIARAIADRVGLDAAQLEFFRHHGMYLDDLSECTADCVC